MNSLIASLAPLRAALLALALGAGLTNLETASAQANANPPERMTYQGFLVDGDGVALGNSAPKNYDVIFRIYTDQTAGQLLWGEQQTVTVDKGYFSVLLGEGASSEYPRPALSTLFRGGNASDRFVAITVKGIGQNRANVDILPRLRLLTSPYAFLATQATKLVRSDDSADLIYSSGSGVSVNGVVSVFANNFLEFGVGLQKHPDAGKIGYGVLTPGALDIVGGGTSITNRSVKIWAEAGTTFTGPVTATSFNGTFVGSGAGLGGVAKLNVENNFVGNQNISAGDLLLDNNRVINAKNSVGAVETFLIPRGGDNKTTISYGSGGLEIRDSRSRPTLFLSADTRATFSGGVLVRGGYSGPSGRDNAGYAFTGNGGDNDSGMFGDTNGYVRFTSNAQLKFSVFPEGVYSHDRLYAENGMTAILAREPSKTAVFERISAAVRIVANGGGLGSSTASTRSILWDGGPSWNVTSDRRLKKDIVDAEPVLDRALQVQIRRFRFKEEDSNSKTSFGVIAQELQPLFPDMVGQAPDPKTGENFLNVGYGDFGIIAVKAIQEMKARHDAEVKDLREQIAELKTQMGEVLRAASELRVQGDKSKVTASVQR